MNSAIAEWLWRAVLICALGWIGWELHVFHEEMVQPLDDQGAVTASPDMLQSSLDDIHEELAGLSEKVDALMVAMARSK
jgi:hypothetical protein